MNIQNLINQLELEFDEIERGSLSPDSTISEFKGWGSMNALVLIALIDNHYNILLTVEELKNSVTINDLHNVIINRTR